MNNKCDKYDTFDLKLFNVNDFDVLLHKVLKQIRDIVSAEAGTIYIADNDSLCFKVFQNDTKSYEEIYKQYKDIKDVRLPLIENEKYLAVDSYISEKISIVNDLYKSASDDFLGVKEYDKKYNYKTHSIITAPIIHPIHNKKLGVIQLINKIDKINKTFNFNEKDKDTISITSSLIAISIEKAKDDSLKLKKLNEDLIEANKELSNKINLAIKENERKSTIIFHQSKLASMGEMIGNIAHQWRQPLSAISTLASSLSYNIELDNFDKKSSIDNLNNIVETTKYLSQTIDDFRDFYRLDKESKTFNLAKNIKQCISITDASLSESNIKIILDLDESLYFNGFENELKQAILNIVQNAKDALVLNKTLNKKFIFVSLKKVDDEICIYVKDNGGGIKNSIFNDIFKKDFTTKQKVGGSGIGLYMTKFIIEKSFNSEVKVENQNFEYEKSKYKGALFTIMLKSKKSQ